MSGTTYERKREQVNAINRRNAREARDVADGYPGPGDLALRSKCERDFRRFCESYFPEAFALPWSDDHLRVIGRIQEAVLSGGLFALAMPRGSGKTTLCERAVLWATLYGHRRFVCLIGATEAAAETNLEHIQTELSFNELLARDFRQVCHAIRCLENNARRCNGQLFNGEQTLITWSAKRVTLPMLPDSACDGVNVSGATITVAGLTGALKGQAHTLPSGRIVRPEFVLLDDIQTRESANSPSQCADRLAIVQGDVLGMAGPGKKIAAIMPCTVIRAGDVADQLLDRTRNPQWQGERTQAVYSWPRDEKRWEQYASLRADGMRRDEGNGRATEFYEKNRAAMDAGARVAWEARKNPDDLSAIQHMMNLRQDLGLEAFAAEYQNDPMRPEGEALPTLTLANVAEKMNKIKRGIVPLGAEHLTAFVDIHDSLLFWAVVAWSGEFTGWVVDYGTWPGQRRRVFVTRKASPSLASVSPTAGREGAILAGLTALSDELLVREWAMEAEGGTMRIGRCLVDSGYVPDTVYDFCRRSAHSGVLLGSRGYGVTAANRPMHEYHRKPGERIGWNWLVTRTPNKSAQYVRFDTNYWKSFIHARLAVALGDAGSLSLYGREADHHRLLAEHAVSEYPTRVTANGRTVDQWALKPGCVDNHWLDCLVGCAVAASMLGAVLSGSGVDRDAARKLSRRITTGKAPKKSYAEQYAEWRSRRG